MTLLAEMERIAALAAAAAPDGARVAAVLAAEPRPGLRRYLCAFEDEGRARSWLAVDDLGEPILDRGEVRDAVAISALCEIVAESAFGGDLDDLLAELVALRLTESPPGIDEAEEAVRTLQHAIGAPPQLATPERLDALGAASRALEQALDPVAPSPLTAVLNAAQATVAELVAEILGNYRAPLAG